jgi:hypothetical protein
MRRLLVVLALVLGTAVPAGAAEQPAGAPTAAPVAAPTAADGWEQPKAYEQLTQREREREMQAQQWQGPSGFWTSPHKSAHGAYRYRMMGIGAALLLAMALVIVRLIRRANAERTAR